MGKLNEKLQPNVVNAPILFVGCGGKGSEIVKGVADRALHDDNSLLGFVCMDTDVNDILNVNKGANVHAVQTSSTATIETYLKNDQIAREHWFPVNKMLEPKPVSEGAGQVRAISRLALNASIKEGKIVELFNAIDKLFLKDGGSFKQAIKVCVVSTIAGGTGSGIAMEVGMLIRHYINKNYPEAAVLIRGFLILPGVMDTVIKAQGERDSIRANGYATIKEINAFMMKGSGFIDTVPELQRYKDLCISIPSATAGEEKLSNLPFDFCFLMDKTDSNSGNMISLPQYIEFAAQSIYEMAIGPMNKSASSKEDNVLKLCIRPESLGRCRFGGIGAAKLVYPYEAIRTYIALNWACNAIMGVSADETMSEAEREELLKNSWLQYDEQYRQALKEYEENPAAGFEPKIEDVYVDAMNQGRNESAGNTFTARLWKQYLDVKILETKETDGPMPTLSSPERETVIDFLFDEISADSQKVMKNYIATIIEEFLTNGMTALDSTFTDSYEKMFTPCTKAGVTFEARYTRIHKIQRLALNTDVDKAVISLAKGIFYSKAPLNKAGLGKYMLEKFVTANNKAMHPNAVRFMLYELKKFLIAARQSFLAGSDDSSMIRSFNEQTISEDGGKSQFDVSKTHIKKENSLEAMCEICDKKELYDAADGQNCNNKLSGIASLVKKYLICKIGLNICDVAIPAVDNLIKAYQDFFNSFSSKIYDIEKKKEDIVTALKFNKGDYVYNLFNSKELLDHLVRNIDRPVDSGEAASELYAKIFENVRGNSYIQSRKFVGAFDMETSKDIFDDVIIGYYENMVENNADRINVDNILQAAKLEFLIDTSLKVANTAPAQREKRQKELKNDINLKKYILDLISKCNKLAAPGIKKNTQEEAHEASAITCSDSLMDGNGIRIGDYLATPVRSNTVSAYELRFFRAVYNITPVQLSKFAAPSTDEVSDMFAFSSEGELDLPSAGDYFRVYQRYMDTIGPDSRTSAVITPHVDQRWNAISVLPELDMDYQSKLMSKIHKAMLYGFIYSRIFLKAISEEDKHEKVYKYNDNDEDKHDLIVSNGTRCDLLYEVLDALYFDRMAVSIIRDYVNATRIKAKEVGCKSFEDSPFFRELKTLNLKRIINLDEKAADATISLFEIVLLYCNSLPAQKKDHSEMKIMITSIIEMIHDEIKLFTPNADTVMARTADTLISQYKLFVDRYIKNKDTLCMGLFSDEVIESTRGALIKFFKGQDLYKFVEIVKGIDTGIE